MKCESCKIFKDMPEGSCCIWHMDNVVCGNKTTEECTEYIPGDKEKKRFIVHFHHPYYNEPSYEDQINTYAETNGLTIVQIAPLYGNGIFVLFEKGGE